MINDFSSYDDIPLTKLDEKLRKEHFEREQDWIRFVAKEYGIPVNWTDVVSYRPALAPHRAVMPLHCPR